MFRISYMWYSFMGTVLTVLFGIIISVVTDKITQTKILNLAATGSSSLPAAAQQHRKSAVGEFETVFIVEKYRKSVDALPMQNMNGFDNKAMRLDES